MEASPFGDYPPPTPITPPEPVFEHTPALKLLRAATESEWQAAFRRDMPAALAENQAALALAISHDEAVASQWKQSSEPFAKSKKWPAGEPRPDIDFDFSPVVPPPPLENSEQPHQKHHQRTTRHTYQHQIRIPEHYEPVLHTVHGEAFAVLPFRVPIVHNVPHYKAWSHTKINTLSRETGQRMFYTDHETGETIPFGSDEEDDEDDIGWADGQVLEGLERDMVDMFIMKVVKTLGEELVVMQALAHLLGVTVVSLRERIADMLWVESGCHIRTWNEKKDKFQVMDYDFAETWCRQCRAFGCNIHQVAPYRPVHGPIKTNSKPKPHDSPCSPDCYMCPKNVAARATKAQQQEQFTRNDANAAGPASATVDPVGMASALQSVFNNNNNNTTNNTAAGNDNASKWSGERSRLSSRDPRLLRMAATTSTTTGSQQQQQQQQDVLLTSVPARRKSPDSPGVRFTHASATEEVIKEIDADIIRLTKNTSLNGGNGVEEEEEESNWTEWEKEMASTGVEMWGRKAPCKIALMVTTRTCNEVYDYLMTLPGSFSSDEEEEEEEAKAAVVPKRRRKGASKQKKAAPRAAQKRLKMFNEKRAEDGEKLYPQYNPCNCVGKCSADCPCNGDANFCEKFCGCDPALCGNRWQGCVCKNSSKRCTRKTCPCMAAQRECDPDLCHECRPSLDGSHREGWYCNNFRVRLGQKTRVLMGLSDIQGWGAFSQQDTPKDGYLGEYVGELIDHEEADRRGKAYDKDDNSYLFDLNQDWVIDARHKGNKLRFANHSSQANCRAKILMVDGDHRVAIIANRDISAGDELFYDYNYEKRVAPNWAKR